MGPPYAASLYAPRRRPTREVSIGDVGVGGANPIRVQSMTTTNTLDTDATVDQIERMVGVGCEIARVTAPSIRDAENLAEIVRALRARDVGVPLVADIHYTPNAAMIAAEHVEKIRINPGNYADKKKFAVREYDDAQWAEETRRVAERFRPLVRRCRELGRAMRIGTNHGSLSDRILNRFGDTPLGMVESALEFLDVCEDEGYRDVVFSMKASNTQVAVQAYRLLAARLGEREEGPSYPFHIGVTEAGDGEDGRVKSAIGIGALLEDGIGDTVRVSLTEDPLREVPVAEALARRAEALWARSDEPPESPGAPFVDDPYAHRRRATRSVGPAGFEIGGDAPVRVELELGSLPLDLEATARELASQLATLRDVVCEGVVVDVMDFEVQSQLESLATALERSGLSVPLAVRSEAGFPDLPVPAVSRQITLMGVLSADAELAESAASAVRTGLPLEWELRGRVSEIPAQLDRALAASAAAGAENLLVSVDCDLPVHGARLAAARLRALGAADVPIVLRHRRDPSRSGDAGLCAAGVELGSLLVDGIGDAVAIGGPGDAGEAVDLAYRVLQGARLRTSWTEFISCPSCGRTLFDLEETTARIKERTGHLRGLKIAVMGCIVNGPGEMADADFGYVGSGPGRVNLYVGQDLVERNLSDEIADDRLVDLIKKHDRWVDP